MGIWNSKPDPRPLSLRRGSDYLVDASRRGRGPSARKLEALSRLGREGPGGDGVEELKGEGEDVREAELEEEETEEMVRVAGLEEAGEVFYKFVILHAEDDVDEALRVQQLLQDEFRIRPGIIFAEMPCGRHHLQNLDDAVNGSAWTIVLLTENFVSEAWCQFQFYTSLVNSVNRQHKYNSVIPVRPLNNPLPRQKTPFALRTINALEEGSRAFPAQVEKIFQESVYRKQEAIWRDTKNTGKWTG
ncbi:TIR domain-containing adapter molecule 2 [Tachyglossus aculeatus]|uniref:TIR domain-containing adapter molecule 2 n=1 Tax=Tachyglossus aculeatus TaxID=9261 RepID=UPI0018F6561C|nr:TIR domain-containing adapter molecule 2 [Tachyglossus aculeatus]